MRTGIVGLGAMGLGMARNLAKAGHLVAVYNRTQSKAQQLADELKVNACQSLTELAKQSDLIITCVSADLDVIEVVNTLLPALSAGSIIVDTSTVSSDTARQLASLLSKHDIGFLDAPVSGGVEGARLGTLAMMIGGEELVLNRAQPVLQSIAKRVAHLGPNGAGQACKAVNQIMAAGINQAVCEALAFAEAQNLELHKVIDVVKGGAAGNWFLDHRGHAMADHEYKVGFKLALHHKDLAICQQMAKATGAMIPISTTTLADYEQLIQQGYGDNDISGLFRLKRSPKI